MPKGLRASKRAAAAAAVDGDSPAEAATTTVEAVPRKLGRVVARARHAGSGQARRPGLAKLSQTQGPANLPADELVAARPVPVVLSAEERAAIHARRAELIRRVRELMGHRNYHHRDLGRQLTLVHDSIPDPIHKLWKWQTGQLEALVSRFEQALGLRPGQSVAERDLYLPPQARKPRKRPRQGAGTTARAA